MGEYAKYNGQEIKIGTCENMYYLRADQAEQVHPLPGNVDPIRDRHEIRFRFPWPDEDRVAPGTFANYERAVHIPGVELPAELEHESVQFTAPQGYLTSLPCPESVQAESLLVYPGGHTVPWQIHRNGFVGKVRLVQQKWVGKQLVIVCMCACGAKFRVPTIDDTKPYINACIEEAEKRPSSWWKEVAERILRGYEGKVR